MSNASPSAACGAPVPLPPDDPTLPQLRRLLNLELVADHLAECFVPGVVIECIRPELVISTPGVRCMVSYGVWVDGQREIATAHAGDRTALDVSPPPTDVLGSSIDGRSRVARPRGFDVELDAFVHWYPVDPAMPALATRLPALDCRLQELGIDTHGTTPTVLNYRPTERAVLGLDTVILKTYASEIAFRAAVAGFAHADRVLGSATAQLVGAAPELRLTAQTRLAGTLLEHDSAIGQAGWAGETLRRLHSSSCDGIAANPPERQMALAEVAGRLASALRPDLAPRIDPLMGRLLAAAPAGLRTVPCHGDFNVSQMLQRDDGSVALLDFDDTCDAPAALDVAGYAANIVSGRPGDLDRARIALEALVAAYGSRPDGLDWYLATAILRRAPSPFRLQKHNWPDRLESIIAAAEAVVA